MNDSMKIIDIFNGVIFLLASRGAKKHINVFISFLLFLYLLLCKISIKRYIHVKKKSTEKFA